MSFQLVDQITSIEAGVHARGLYRVRSAAGTTPRPLPVGLLVEAVGQLASWAAMPQLDFEFRPVAASAGLVEVFHPAPIDAPIEIEVTITSIRHQAISYQGKASSNGKNCITLQRAIGPLLPIAEFDDKVRIKSIFEMLCDTGIPPRSSVAPADYEPVVTRGAVEPAVGFTCSLRLPQESPIYADHFPRQPVFPASLLLQTQIDETRRTYARADGSLREILKVSGVKIRAFSGPGEELSFRAKQLEAPAGQLQFRLETWREETRVSAANLYLRG